MINIKKTVSHPLLPWTITFDPTSHTYTDNESRPYTSVTTLVKSFFPPFDEQSAATRIAAQTGKLEIEILSAWHQKRIASAAFGTRVHAYAEALIQNLQLLSPTSEQEQRAFAVIDRAVNMLSDSYELIAVEQIIFDPLFLLAGTIDLVAINRSTGALTITDWKTCESITDESYGYALAPIQDVRVSKLSHYTLQLSMYALLLSDADYSGYSSAGQETDLALIHIAPHKDDPIWMPIENKRAECVAMIESKKFKKAKDLKNAKEFKKA